MRVAAQSFNCVIVAGVADTDTALRAIKRFPEVKRMRGLYSAGFDPQIVETAGAASLGTEQYPSHASLSQGELHSYTDGHQSATPDPTRSASGFGISSQYTPKVWRESARRPGCDALQRWDLPAMRQGLRLTRSTCCRNGDPPSTSGRESGYCGLRPPI